MRTSYPSYKNATAVTPNDTNYIAVTDGIFIGGAGNLNVEMANGSTALFTAPTVGTYLPISVRKVLATNTTATNIVALYS